MIECRKKENETSGSLLFRFSRRVKHSGVLTEARHRRFRARPVSRIKVRLSARHRDAKKKELERLKKLGLV